MANEPSVFELLRFDCTSLCLYNSHMDAVLIYSRTSVTRTSVGPQKFVLDMASSSHSGLIIAPVQESKGDSSGMSFRFSIK